MNPEDSSLQVTDVPGDSLYTVTIVTLKAPTPPLYSTQTSISLVPQPLCHFTRTKHPPNQHPNHADSRRAFPQWYVHRRVSACAYQLLSVVATCFKPNSPRVSSLTRTCAQNKDSSFTYVHMSTASNADLFEDFCKDKLPSDEIFVPPQHQPLNPEDEDDVVPDQHAAFGITRATKEVRGAAWKDLGLGELMRKGPPKGVSGKRLPR